MQCTCIWYIYINRQKIGNLVEVQWQQNTGLKCAVQVGQSEQRRVQLQPHSLEHLRSVCSTRSRPVIAVRSGGGRASAAGPRKTHLLLGYVFARVLLLVTLTPFFRRPKAHALACRFSSDLLKTFTATSSSSPVCLSTRRQSFTCVQTRQCSRVRGNIW